MGDQTKATALIERLQEELTLDGATLNRLPLLDAAQSSQGAVQGEEVVSGGTIRPTARLQGYSRTVDINNRTTRTAPASSGICLVVACVEIAVSVSVFGGISIKSTNDTRKDTELLARIVANNSYLNTN